MSPYVSHLQTRKKRKKFQIFLFIFLVAVFLGGIPFLVSLFQNKQPIRIVNPLGSLETPLKTTQSFAKSSSALGKVVNSVLDNTTGTYGIYIKNLATGEEYVKNPDKVFVAASLYKLWVMVVAYQQIESGNLQKNTVLSQDVAILNNEFNIDSAVAEQTEGSISSSVDDLLTNMIEISDNYSGLLLAEKVKLSSVATFIQKNNLLHSSVGAENTDNLPTTTAEDMGVFLEKLYDGNFADMEDTEEMITLLKSQRLNEKIPQYLPDGVVVAHKTGELDSYSHDAGIVYTQNGNYIIVILTNTPDTVTANETIGQISKSVYEYFTQ